MRSLGGLLWNFLVPSLLTGFAAFRILAGWRAEEVPFWLQPFFGVFDVIAWFTGNLIEEPVSWVAPDYQFADWFPQYSVLWLLFGFATRRTVDALFPGRAAAQAEEKKRHWLIRPILKYITVVLGPFLIVASIAHRQANLAYVFLLAIPLSLGALTAVAMYNGVFTR